MRIPRYLYYFTLFSFTASIVLIFACSKQKATTEASGQDDIFQEHFEAYPDLTDVRGGGSPSPEATSRAAAEQQTKKVFKDAMMAYNIKEYGKAVPLFEQVEAQQPDNLAARFYGGISMLGAGETEAATGRFLSLMQETDQTYATHAKWYLGLSFLRSDQKELAVPVFADLRDSQTSYSKKAGKILSRIPEAQRILATKSGAADVLHVGTYKQDPYEYFDIGKSTDVSVRIVAEKNMIGVRYNNLNTSQSTISLYNANGKMVHKESHQAIRVGTEYDIYLKPYPAGKYNLKVKLDGGKIVQQKMQLHGGA